MKINVFMRKTVKMLNILDIYFNFEVFFSVVAVSGKTAKNGLTDLNLRCKHVAVLRSAMCGLDVTVSHGEPLCGTLAEHLFE